MLCLWTKKHLLEAGNHSPLHSPWHLATSRKLQGLLFVISNLRVSMEYVFSKRGIELKGQLRRKQATHVQQHLFRLDMFRLLK